MINIPRSIDDTLNGNGEIETLFIKLSPIERMVLLGRLTNLHHSLTIIEDNMELIARGKKVVVKR